MQELPKEYNRYIGPALIAIAVFPVAEEIAALTQGHGKPLALAGYGLFLMLGVMAVLEAFLWHWLLMLMLFVFGTMFFGTLAYVVPQHALPSHVTPATSIALSAVAALAYYFGQKWQNRISLPDRQTRIRVRRSIERNDRIKRAGEARYGAAGIDPDTSATPMPASLRENQRQDR